MADPTPNTLAPKGCSRCGLTKSAGEFYAEPGRPGGLSSLCKVCKRASNRKYWRLTYYPEHREGQKAAVAERRRERRTGSAEAQKLV